VSENDAEILAARLLAGELPPAEARQLQERIEADPTARAALARLQATVSAMKLWRDNQPRQPLPTASRRQRLWLAPLAAAAALLLAVGLYWTFSTGRQTPVGDGGFGRGNGSQTAGVWAQDEFAFLLGKGKGSMPTRGGTGMDGGLGARPPGEGGPVGAPGSLKGSKPEVLHAPLRKQVDFDFRLPPELPQGYRLAEGTALSRQQLRLSYAADGRSLLVYLKPSAGPDEPAQVLAAGTASQPPLFAARRDGLGIAMQGPVDRAFVEACVKEFVPVKSKP
jgi:hypothetical protein